jgi:ABC-type amino acid transport substrate-binding protein
LEPDAQYHAVVAQRFWLAAALTLAVGLCFSDEVVVAVPLSMQPYFLPIQGRGLEYEAIQAAFAARGHGVRPLYVSSRRIEELITDDSLVDCVPMVLSGSERGWAVTESTQRFHDVAITRAGFGLTTLHDLKNKKILAYSGAARILGNEFRSVIAGNDKYREINNHRAQVRLLLQGVIDVIIADRLLVSWYLDYLRKEGDAIPPVAFHDFFEPVAHEVICRRSSIAAELSAGFALILKDGTLNDILARYGVTEDDEIFLPREQQPPKLNPTSPAPDARDKDE